MKHCRAEAQLWIDVSPGQLWLTIAEMTDMEVWYPGLIAASEVDTSTDVPTRVCTMRDGGTLHERILLRDGATRTFVYAIDSHPLPAQGVVGTIRVDPDGEGAHVTWDAQFTSAVDHADQMTGMISEMYRAGLKSLANHHQS